MEGRRCAQNRMTKILKSLLIFSFVMFFTFVISTEARAEVREPKVENLTVQGIALKLSGTVPFNSDVLIYIDGTFLDQVKASGYRPGVNCGLDNCLEWRYDSGKKIPAGNHKLMAISQDQTSLVLSAPGPEMMFYLSSEEAESEVMPDTEVQTKNKILPFPAPTVFKPVVTQETFLSRPVIVGLAKNNSKIRVYIDQKYSGEVKARNHNNGTANFAFKPRTDLTRGEHSVYAFAIDKNGKASVKSNTVVFIAQNSAIGESALEERKSAVAKIKEAVDENKITGIVISPESGQVDGRLKDQPAKILSPEERQKAIKQELIDREKAALEKVRDAVNPVMDNSSGKGLINEGRENQGKLKLNIILFIVFLLAVVGWLIWVNWELVKERRSRELAQVNKDNMINPPAESQENKKF